MGKVSEFARAFMNAKGASPDPQVPAPKTAFFNLNLRESTMVFIGIDLVIALINVMVIFPFILLPPTNIIWFLLGIQNILVCCIGIWGVHRLIPEWIKVYGIFCIFNWLWVFLQLITQWIQAGGQNMSPASSTVWFVVKSVLTILFLICLKALYSYAIVLRGSQAAL